MIEGAYAYAPRSSSGITASPPRRFEVVTAKQPRLVSALRRKTTIQVLISHLLSVVRSPSEPLRSFRETCAFESSRDRQVPRPYGSGHAQADNASRERRSRVRIGECAPGFGASITDRGAALGARKRAPNGAPSLHSKR